MLSGILLQFCESYVTLHWVASECQLLLHSKHCNYSRILLLSYSGAFTSLKFIQLRFSIGWQALQLVTNRNSGIKHMFVQLVADSSTTFVCAGS